MRVNHPVTDLEQINIRLNYTYLLSVMLGISVILTITMYLQYVDHELPCSLCLLQRLACFGICFGIMLNFREGYRLHHMGFAMLFTIFLLVIGIRQSLLDIIPRPDHHWIGSAILGVHMPVWSIVISLLLLTSYACVFSIIKQGSFLTAAHLDHYPWIKRCATWLSLYVIILCAINLISVFVQCGFNSCHTYSYQLLE